ncbi:MAG: hypothetical protein ABI358_14575 [Ginsengibacter sp.]
MPESHQTFPDLLFQEVYYAIGRTAGGDNLAPKMDLAIDKLGINQFNFKKKSFSNNKLTWFHLHRN